MPRSEKGSDPRTSSDPRGLGRCLTTAGSPPGPACESMSEQERETEEDEGGGPSDTAPMLARRRRDRRAGPSALLLPGRVLAALLLHLLLPGTVFLLVLMPAAAIIYLGFLCHSRVSWALRGWVGGHRLGVPGRGVLWELRALGLR